MSVEASKVAYALDIVGLSKSFTRRATGGGYSSLKSSLVQAVQSLLGRNNKPVAIDKTAVTHAVKDLTIRIPRGASVGLIGRNGSGKSTFLKLLTGIYKPDAGVIRRNGRIAALIELGAGFHPDFTGRENIVLGGVMHGLTRKEIAARADEIIKFAELEHVIDEPVRTYSSGMFMRLGFSLAVHTDPDVLLVDEVLAVGDAGFVKKCKEKIASLRAAGTTLVLVTHDLEAVERWCDEVIWLNRGEVLSRGDPRRVIDEYRQFLEKGESDQIEEHQQQVVEVAVAGEQQSSEPERARWGSREIEILQTTVTIVAPDGNEKRGSVAHPEDGARIAVEYVCNEPTDDVVFGIALRRNDGLMVLGTNTDIERVEVPTQVRRGAVVFEIASLRLLSAVYAIDVAVHRKDGYPFDYHKGAAAFSINSAVNYVGSFVPEHRWRFEVQQGTVA